MLRAFLFIPGLGIGSFLCGLAASLFRGGVGVAWVCVSLSIAYARPRMLLALCLFGVCLGMVRIPEEQRISWSAWVASDASARIMLVPLESDRVRALRRQGIERLRTVLAVREATLAAALLYGEQTFTAKDKVLLRDIGLSHLAAVSGANLSFLVLLLLWMTGGRTAGGRFRIWLQQGLIIVCVIGTGASSSMVRAGIMGSIAVWSRSFGRRSRFLRSLLVAGALIAIVEPFRLVTDLGWQFSALACCGLRMAKVADEGRRTSLIEAFTVSFWAWVWTVPLQLWRFGTWSWVGMIGTVALGPMIELLQIGTTVAIIAPHPLIGRVLGAMLSATWGFFEWLRTQQAPLHGASNGMAYLLLYLPLAGLLIHRITWSWGRNVSSFSDVSSLRTMKTVLTWSCFLPNIFDTSPDLAMPLFVSMLRASAAETG